MEYYVVWDVLLAESLDKGITMPETHFRLLSERRVCFSLLLNLSDMLKAYFPNCVHPHLHLLFKNTNVSWLILNLNLRVENSGKGRIIETQNVRVKKKERERIDSEYCNSSSEIKTYCEVAKKYVSTICHLRKRKKNTYIYGL